MHAEQIERYGGTHGLRDRAGLESALAVPQATVLGVASGVLGKPDAAFPPASGTRIASRAIPAKWLARAGSAAAAGLATG